MAVEAHVHRLDNAPIFDVRIVRLVGEADADSDLEDRHEY
jgi:hypothetical protein